MIVRPIIMSPAMVVGLLRGQKTQTRRLAWGKRKSKVYGYWSKVPSLWQRVAVGDLLYVREALSRSGAYTAYLADGEKVLGVDSAGMTKRIMWRAEWRQDPRPSIHMPRALSRLTLEVVDHRLQRLHAISNHDARWEGVDCWPDYVEGRRDPFPVERYRDLWVALHGVESWDENPEVVALTFQVHRQNVDQFLAERKAA